MIQNPDERIGACSFLTSAEKHQLLVEWNCTAMSFPKDRCVHELFELQVEQTPDVTAVVFEDQRIIYRELNRRANQLAHYLRNLGMGPNTLVGICLERSPEMVVALLGVLKAGGAYLPLDSSYPKDRLKVMLEDARVSVLLTTQSSQTNLLNVKASMVCLDSDWPVVNRESDKNPALRVDGEELAYVIYTSDRFGKPGRSIHIIGIVEPHAVDASGVPAHCGRSRRTEDALRVRCFCLGILCATPRRRRPRRAPARRTIGCRRTHPSNPSPAGDDSAARPFAFENSFG